MRNPVITRVPARLDYYLELAETLGLLLSGLAVEDYDTVLDLGCGWSPKVPIALVRTAFSGVYVAIDRSAAALNTFQGLLDSFDKEFECRCIKADFIDLVVPPAERALVVLNHVLDDLLLFSMFRHFEVEDPYQVPERLSEYWNDIAKCAPILLPRVKEELAALARRLSNNIPSLTLLILQYPGYQENLYGLSLAHTLSVELLNLLKDELLSLEFIEEKLGEINDLWTPGQYRYFEPKDVLCLRLTRAKQ